MSDNYFDDDLKNIFSQRDTKEAVDSFIANNNLDEKVINTMREDAVNAKREKRTVTGKISRDRFKKSIICLVLAGSIALGIPFIKSTANKINRNDAFNDATNSMYSILYDQTINGGYPSIVAQNTHRTFSGGDSYCYYDQINIATDYLKIYKDVCGEKCDEYADILTDLAQTTIFADFETSSKLNDIENDLDVFFNYSLYTICDSMGSNIDNKVGSNGKSNIDDVLSNLNIFSNADNELNNKYISAKLKGIEGLDDYLITYGFVDENGNPSRESLKEYCLNNVETIDSLVTSTLERGETIKQ